MKIALISSVLLISNLLFSQQPEIAWQKTLGGLGSDEMKTFILTDDGGYLLGGTSVSDIFCEKEEDSRGLSDFWIIKLDAERNIEWQRTFGGTEDDHMQDILQCNDGGYLLGGYSNSGISGEKTEASYGDADYWVIRIDELGNILWDKTIGGAANDILVDMVNHNDSTYVLGGHSQSDSSGMKSEDSRGEFDFWLVNIDDSGEVLWQHTFGGDSTDNLFTLEKTLDNGFIAGGDTKSEISGDKLTPLNGEWDFWMLKLDENGYYEWDNSVGGDYQNAYGHAYQSTDGNYVVGGTSNSGIGGYKTEPNYNISMWVLKFEPGGDLIWENTLAGEEWEYLMDMKPTLDGGTVIVGHSNSEASVDKSESSDNNDFWIVKLDVNGIIEWENTLTTENGDEPAQIMAISESEYLIGGYSHAEFEADKHDQNRGSEDYWLVKLALCDSIDNSVTVFENEYGTPLSITANAEGYEYQWFECGSYHLELVPGATEQTYEAEWFDFEGGEYTVRISDGECETFSECTFIKDHYWSIHENILETISVYPNPVNDFLYLDCDANVSVTLLNITGEVVLRDIGNKVNMSTLSEGTYILNIYTNDGDLISVSRVVRE